MSEYVDKNHYAISEFEEDKIKNNPINGQFAKNKKLNKMLSTAALSVALISWYSTANGLHQYVFDNIWQAYIISAALQGVLFALSLKGIPIFFKLNHIAKKAFFVIVWACLLCASSIFSYVYISATVYSDQLLREDAHRIFTTDCLSKYYNLRTEADKLLNGFEDNNGVLHSMNNYVDKLAVLDKGINLSEGGYEKKFDSLKKAMLQYAYTYSADNIKGDIIKECIDTSKLVSCLDEIKDGKCTKQDIIDTNNEINNLINSINKRIYENEKKKKQKIKERNDYQKRLKTFYNTEGVSYKNLTKLLKNVINEINALDDLISRLNTEITNINRVSDLMTSLENSMSSFLYNLVVDIRNEMNKEKIETETIKNKAEKIYEKLLENSSIISADDERLVNYSEFKNDIKRYNDIINAQTTINGEIKLLYELKSIYELQNTSNENLQKEKTNDKPVGNSVTENSDEWKKYWTNHINLLKESAETLQLAGLDETIIIDLINTLESKERLYLSDLNDFERAWSLLFGIHPEQYKTLLKFSFGFAFGIDLFAVFVSALLYLFRQNHCDVNLKREFKK